MRACKKMVTIAMAEVMTSIWRMNWLVGALVMVLMF